MDLSSNMPLQTISTLSENKVALDIPKILSSVISCFFISEGIIILFSI